MKILKKNDSQHKFDFNNVEHSDRPHERKQSENDDEDKHVIEADISDHLNRQRLLAVGVMNNVRKHVICTGNTPSSGQECFGELRQKIEERNRKQMLLRLQLIQVDSKENLGVLQTKKANLKQENSEMDKREALIKERESVLLKEKEKMINVFKEKDNEIQLLQSNIQELQMKSKQKLEVLQTKMKNLQKENSEMDKSIQELQMKSKQKLEVLQTKMKNLQKENSEMDKRIAFCKEKISLFLKERMQMTNICEGKDEEIKFFKLNIQELQMESKQKLEVLQTKMIKLQKENSEMDKMKAVCKETISLLLKERKQMMNVCEGKDEEIKFLKSNIQELQLESKQKLEVLQTKMMKLQKENSELDKIIREQTAADKTLVNSFQVRTQSIRRAQVPCSDPNTSTEIDKEYSRLFANEWTRALAELEENGEQKKSIMFLYQILQRAYFCCKHMEHKFAESFGKALLSVATNVKDLFDTAIQVRGILLTLEDCITQMFFKDYKEYETSGSAVKAYIRDAVAMCWLMVIQIPCAFLSNISTKNNVHDYFDSYGGTSGSYVDFVAWPAIKKEGQVISKGKAALK